MKKSKQLKVAMLGHKRIPSREGGIEVVVEELATRMAKRGHSITCYNRRGHHVSGKKFTFQKLREYQGVKLKYVFTVNIKGFAALTASLSSAFMATFGTFDVVHFHAEGSCVMLWLPKLLKKKCVVTIHGLDHQRSKWGKFASRYILFCEKIAAKYADEIIVLSKSVQTYFKDTYGRETTFVPNGVNRPIIRKANLIKKKYNLDKDSYILFLGRIVPEKGIQYLIEAFKQLNTDKSLVIAGGASDTNEFMNKLIRESHGNKKIIFTGFVQGEILDELYSNAYLYSLPSDLEGMSLSLLEAMSYGNCCLVSDIDECTSVVNDKAIIFKKADVYDLSKKLQKACIDASYVEGYKVQAADYICNKYNWDDVVDKTLKLYCSL